jgi:nitrogen fixation/metabolism regulation signal transduction histidine kinase
VTRALRYALVIVIGVGSILLFLLASASENSAFFNRNFNWLLGVVIASAVVLSGMVAVVVWRLYARVKAGAFGSKLMRRLVLLFAGIGIFPAAMIFVVSYLFVSHSIESWFDVKIEQALDSGLNLGRAALDESLSQLSATASTLAVTLAGQGNDASRDIMARAVGADTGMQSVMLLTADGRVLASVSADPQADLTPDLPKPQMLRQAGLPAGYARSEGGEDAADPKAAEAARAAAGVNDAPGEGRNALDAATSLRQRVVVEVPEPPGMEKRYLQLLQAVPVNLASNAEVLQTAYSEYQNRQFARVGLRKMYRAMLTLTMILAMFSAVGAAFLIANNLAQPLLVLAEGTRAVAEGDLSPRPIVATNDELGTLTQSFNAMTGQLFEARSAVERNRAALERAKVHLESVLGNMSAGVIVMDADGVVVNSNDAAHRILPLDATELQGRPLDQIEGLEAFAGAVTRAFSAQSARTAAGRNRPGPANAHWQQQIEVPRRVGGHDDHDLTLLARGSRLPVGPGSGFIVVFDDISDVISAQRSVAWGEVARRLAHEIKNPLTPIQLAAERLQMKLADRLDPAGLTLLNKATDTIVNQVDAMKRMVDDFRDYAKAPPATLDPLDLNALIYEILNLYLAEDDSDVIHSSLAPNLPRVMGDATQLRQVIHNLLQNAQDALADLGPGGPVPRIDLITETIHYQGADGAAGTAVRLAIVDNGPGFSPKILSRAFEPYVTSKARGTGLGLPMVKKIVDEHGGRIDVANRADGRGASVSILLLKLAPEANLADT